MAELGAEIEIRSFDFLSYGKRVNQGLQNLIDHNQYITEHFIKNMRANTERMHGLEEEFRRLSDLITYSGEGVQAKEIKLSTDGNLETTNIDSEEENLPNQGNEEGTGEETELDMTGWGGMFPLAGAASALEVDRDEVMADARYLRNLKYGQNVLTNYMLNHGIGNDEEIKDFIDCITERRPGLLIELFVVDSNSSRDVWNVYDKIFNEIPNVQNVEFNDIYCQYNLMITVEDVESLDMGEPMNQTQRETFVACWNRLVSMRVPETHIIAVMANIYAESRYSAANAQNDKGYPRLVDEDYVFKTDDGVGYGIIQWTYKGRKEGLLNYANDYGGSVYDLETQLNYFQYEMEEGGCRGYWKDFLGKETLRDATECFMEEIEKPLICNIDERMGYANDIEAWYSNIE